MQRHLKRCGCCRGQSTCPFSRIEGEVLLNPTAEHCAITLVDGVLRKYLKPRADLVDWHLRAALATRHPDLFEPFSLVGRVAVQRFVPGERADRMTLSEINAELTRRRIAVYDVCGKNVIGGKIVDFAIPRPCGVREPRPKRR